MATLDGFINDVITEMRTISGIKHVPNDPAPDPATWPFAPVWASEGDAKTDKFGVVTYLHSVQVGLLAPANDANQEEANQIILPKLETVIENLFGKRNALGYSDISTFGDITYTYGYIEWAGAGWFGAIFTIDEVKIENTL